MNEYLFIYLLQLCDVITIFQIIGGCVWFISLGVILIMLSDDICNKTLITINILTVVLVIFLSLLPTKKTLLLGYSVYFGKQALTTERYQKINTIIDLKLDDYIKQLREANDE